MTTRLGRACEPLVRAHPDWSGLVPLPDGHDAFAARVLVADAAEHTLDVQYYIWRHDMSGALLLAALLRAADRGVRVRLLLDDNNTSGLDAVLTALDQHRNIEVRLFNPFRMRRWRLLGYLTDFQRLNRRMHNKSFTADGHVTIIGGRNVGDEYFDTGPVPWFVDMDVLAIGPVVSDVVRDFDRYWTSASSTPVARVLPKAGHSPLEALAHLTERDAHHPTAQAYADALSRSPLVRDLLAGRLSLEWAATRLISDDPAKGLGRAPEHALLWPRLKESLGAPQGALRLVSPYFVPRSAGVEELASLVRQGVQVTVLTNALEATDVAAVHAGYAKRREALLIAGVVLFELKRGPPRSRARRRPWTTGPGSGSSASSLHAKTVSVDRSRVFVGSFNFDPRSVRLNTEMGFVIDSALFAETMVARFTDEVPVRAYQVCLTARGLLWLERDGGQQVVHEREPGVGIWRRLAVSVLSRLPIEWLL